VFELGYKFGRVHRFSFGMRRLPPKDAGLKMAAEQFNSQGIERGSNSGNLIQDIDAIPVLIDHALDTGDLTGYAICPAPDTLHGAAIHRIYIYQVYVYGKLDLL
jgi:hypothetical protein